jgi:hypothetical protein
MHLNGVLLNYAQRQLSLYLFSCKHSFISIICLPLLGLPSNYLFRILHFHAAKGICMQHINVVCNV